MATSPVRSAFVSSLGAFLLVALIQPGLPAAQDASSVEPSPVDRQFANALTLHQAGDVLGAIQAYKAVLAEDDGHIGALVNLGAAYVRLGQYDEAIASYERALKLEPANVPARLNLGLALYKRARYPEAIEQFKNVLAADPENIQALLLAADIHLQMGQPQAVIDLLSPRKDALSDNPAFAYLLGMALITTGDTQGGQVMLDAIFRRGETAEGHVLMATAHLRAFDYPAALKELERAIELNPSLPAVHSIHGRALLGSGDQEGAARAFLRALELNPNDFDANLQLGEARKRDQRYDEALTYLQRALAVRPQDTTAQYALAGLYLATGKTEEARVLLERVVAEAPKFTQGHVLLATVYYRLQRREDGDRERAIVERLNAEAQAAAPGASEELGPAYRGQPSTPSATPTP